MLSLIIILVVVAVLVGATATFLVTSRRRSRTLSPPAGPPGAGPLRPAPPAPSPPTTPARAPPAPADAPPLAETPAVQPGQKVPAEGAAPEGSAPAEAPAPPEADPGTAPSAEQAGVEVLERPRFKDRLGKARTLFSGYLTSVRGKGRIDDATWDDLEEALILADVGIETTGQLLDDLRARVKKEGIDGPDALVEALKDDMVSLLAGERALRIEAGATNVWLFVGVNGVGKTTTIGKLGQRLVADGHKVVMAAGDTFRAAAADQLGMWAERTGAVVIRGNEGGDPGAVIFDAVQHAAARDADVVLADTAGRLHNKVNLMEELKKVRRVAGREPGQVQEVLLVIDATTGQNGLVQAKIFTEAVEVTGVVLTKLDGTAKGGIAFAISAQLGIPIKLVGLGEGAADLVDFDPQEFVDALVGGD